MRHLRLFSTYSICILSLLAPARPTHAAPVPATPQTAKHLAKHLLELSAVSGGLILHLGAGDGRLTAALGSDTSYTVQGLEADPAHVARARAHIQSLGIYGRVSVEHFTQSVLPYADNLINLVVAQDLGKIPLTEVLRVLAPGGALCRPGENGQWIKRVKAWPAGMDQWTHYLHGANNNAVANDTAVGPPRHLRWVAGPLWLRSHETPSGIQAPVSANGRLFYFFDEGLIGITDERLPDRWSLVCRDAFNGRLLWQQPLRAWGWREWSKDRYTGKDWTTLRAGRVDVPAQNQRRLVAVGNRLFTTLAYRGPLTILDAATGRILATIETAQDTREILVSDGIGLAYTQAAPTGPARRRGQETHGGAALVAVETQTGKVLWQKNTSPLRPLSLAIDNGRIIFIRGKDMIALRLRNGEELWRIRPRHATPRTLLVTDDVVVMQGGKNVAAYDATNGQLLWQKTVPPISGGEGDDLFVVDGLVWRGVLSVDEEGKPERKSPNALALGWALRTGEEQKRILARNLRSPEHHHRCYRNKATSRYLISSYEGAEFVDFQAGHHSQNNWVRGVCRNGMMPCNGLLYVPPDQCFCQPGAKLLGYTALSAGPEQPWPRRPDAERLERGPAYHEKINPEPLLADDWPTFRHDAARHGATPRGVPTPLRQRWEAELGGPLTPPVAAGNRVLVAKPDEHTVYALDLAQGNVLWRFTANGRIDSPPTIDSGRVLFGSRDGWVYCLRVTDGALVWRFLAAPSDHRVVAFDQVESAWPVHGSVLVDQGIAYCTAGRSTYLDGGIEVYGLEPATGKLLHHTRLHGPNPDETGQRDFGFYILGANSDVLVSEGGYLYMRQKKLTPDLHEVEVPVKSSKGAQDVGLHVFSTSGLLDGSWYNRTFWMYSQRWPGFQLANQAPKTGQLLVVDEQRTYAVRVFYRRNVHSPMFFPATNGYLLFADANTNEPQIVGEPGAREPVAWLPQSDFSRGRGNQMRKLNSEAFGLDKMIGYTRAAPPVWQQWLPVRIRAMVKAGPQLFVAGAPDELDAQDPYAAFEGRKGAHLVSLSAQTGQQLATTPLPVPPVFDGMIAARGHLIASLENGRVICLGGKPSP